MASHCIARLFSIAGLVPASRQPCAVGCRNADIAKPDAPWLENLQMPVLMLQKYTFHRGPTSLWYSHTKTGSSCRGRFTCQRRNATPEKHGRWPLPSAGPLLEAPSTNPCLIAGHLDIQDHAGMAAWQMFDSAKRKAFQPFDPLTYFIPTREGKQPSTCFKHVFKVWKVKIAKMAKLIS